MWIRKFADGMRGDWSEFSYDGSAHCLTH